MAMLEGVWLFNIIMLVVLLIMVVSLTMLELSPSRAGVKGWERFAIYGVSSFIIIGAVMVSYIVFLALVWGDYGPIYNWFLPLKDQEFDLAQGFFTVLVGAAAGVFTAMFAYLRFRGGRS